MTGASGRADDIRPYSFQSCFLCAFLFARQPLPSKVCKQSFDGYIHLLLEPAKPVLRIVDKRAKALSYFPVVCRHAEDALKRPFASNRYKPTKKKPFTRTASSLESGGDLLFRAVSSQVPSALKGLTSVFGMGTGGTPSPLPPEIVAFVGGRGRCAFAHSSYLPKVPFLPLWESSSPLKLSLLPFGLLTLPGCILRYIKFNACYAFA